MLEIFPGGMYEKGIFINFTKFTGKKIIQVSYLTKFEALV